MREPAHPTKTQEDFTMTSKLLFGLAALALFAAPAFAEDYVGGALKTSTINGANVLTDAKGMTLYTYDKDTAGVSNCYDKCATAWPPAFADASAKADGDFTLVKRTDGKMMWAYKGMPLYLWIKDTKPGDTTGDMVGNVWHTAIEK
jgi:predicted lipoprotein with Yx(FWY)xxD motif